MPVMAVFADLRPPRVRESETDAAFTGGDLLLVEEEMEEGVDIVDNLGLLRDDIATGWGAIVDDVKLFTDGDVIQDVHFTGDADLPSEGTVTSVVAFFTDDLGLVR